MSWFSKHIFNNIHPAAIGAALVTVAGVVTSPEVLAILPSKVSVPLAAVGIVLQAYTRSVSNTRTVDGAAKIVARQDTGSDSEPAASEAMSAGAQRVFAALVVPGVPSIAPVTDARMTTWVGPVPVAPSAPTDVHNTPSAGI